MPCSVVIPCHNGAALTRACLDSLLAQDFVEVGEVLLVDNNSDDATPDLAAIDPRVRILRQATNLGFAAGVNVGLRAARQPLVLILNNDTQAARNLLHELRCALLHDPAIAAAAPVSNHVKGPALLPVGELGRTAPGRAAIAAELRRAPSSIQDVDTLAGLCLLLRRSTLDEVGLFDERFGHGNYEDDDLCLRLRLGGHRLVIARRAFLHHEGHATFRSLGLDLTEQLRHRQRQFIDKWQHDPAGRATIAAMRGDLEAAAAAARESQVTHPRWPDADWHLGRWRAQRNEPDRAAPHFAALLRHGPWHDEAALELGLGLLWSGDTAEAHRQLRTVSERPLGSAQQVRLFRDLGRHAYQHGQAHLAKEHFRTALELQPDAGDLHNWLGLCALETADPAAAASHFRRAIADGFALAHTNLGICQHQLGDPDAARASFATAVRLLPRDAVALANHAALCGVG